MKIYDSIKCKIYMILKQYVSFFLVEHVYGSDSTNDIVYTITFHVFHLFCSLYDLDFGSFLSSHRIMSESDSHHTQGNVLRETCTLNFCHQCIFQLIYLNPLLLIFLTNWKIQSGNTFERTTATVCSSQTFIEQAIQMWFPAPYVEALLSKIFC